MDGNEGELPIAREGKGDLGSIKKAGAPTKTPKGSNKRMLASSNYVTPSTGVKQFTKEQFSILSNRATEGKKQVMAEQTRKEAEEMEAEQTDRTSTMLSLKSIMYQLNRKQNLDDDSMRERTADEESEYRKDGWMDDEDLDEELTDETELDEDMALDDGQNQGMNKQDVEGGADFGKSNDFTRASSLSRSSMATNNRNVQTSGLDGINRMNHLAKSMVITTSDETNLVGATARTDQDISEPTETTIMENSNNGIESTNRIELGTTGNLEPRNKDDSNLGLEGTTGINSNTGAKNRN